MIKLENYEVVGWEHAVRGMRNPMNSWAKSDSVFKETTECDYLNDHGRPDKMLVQFDALSIGENDHALMMKLANAGPVHGKFRRMITVYVDITAPLYWWKEFDTYKVGTVANSCSTMHKIHEKEFTLEDFSCEHLCNVAMSTLRDIVSSLNSYRSIYLNWDNEIEVIRTEFNNDRKNAWWQMIQLLPSSYNQKRTVQLNYEVLAGIYKYRKNHKLDEWREFCAWIETLPYSEIIIGGTKE